MRNLLQEKIDQLTPEEQQEVLKFVDKFLDKTSQTSFEHKPRFNWAGGLSDLKDQFTSVQLQKKINEWW